MRLFNLLSLCILLVSFNTHAGNGEWSSRIELTDVYIGHTYSLYDPIWTGTGQNAKLYTNYEAFTFLEYTRKNQSDLQLNDDWKIHVTVKYWVDQTTTATEVLTISSEQGSYIYSDYFKVPILAGNSGFDVVVQSVEGEYFDGSWISVVNPQNDSHFPVDVDLRTELRSTLLYDIDHTTSPYQNEYSQLTFDDNDYRISWSFLQGAEMYDLEWVYIDTWSDEAAQLNSIFAGTLGDLAGGDYAKPFELKEPTNVRLSKTNYTLDKTYPEGKIYFRVRPVTKFVVNGILTEKVRLGKWSYFSNLSALNGTITANDILVETIDQAKRFENDKNWLYGVAFAEEGKSVTSVTVYDGSNRGRQSMTYNTSDDITLIGESKFDNEGRQSISVIPAPVQGRQFGYVANFNRVSGNPLGASHFDKNDYYEQSAIPLDVTSGAAKYFSASNDFNDDLFQHAVPDADGYVYSQTIYRNDGSGRVERVGGIGAEFQAGGFNNGSDWEHHAVETFYVSPTQVELKRLFGSNVPDDITGYRKEAVRDANGQYSVTYYDKRGNVIATALAGEAPTNLIPLDDQESDEYVTVISNSTLVDPFTSVTEHTHMNYVENSAIQLSYDMVAGAISTINSQQVSAAGQEVLLGDICVSCIYNVELKVLNSSGDEIYASGYTETYEEVVQASVDCEEASNGTGWLTYSTSVPGEYRIILTVSVDPENMHQDLISGIQGAGLWDLQTFTSNYTQALDVSGCFFSCEDYCINYKKAEFLEDNPGGDWDQYWGGKSPAEKNAYIEDCINNNCDLDLLYQNPEFDGDLINTPDDETYNPFEGGCESKKNLMIDQISPGGDFFDNTNSEFWTEVLEDGNLFDGTATAQVTIGGVVYNGISALQNLTSMPDAVAEVLLPHHRESCHLDRCSNWAKTEAYSSGLVEILTDPSIVVDNGVSIDLLIAGNTYQTPYTNTITADQTYTSDPFLNEDWGNNNELQDALSNYYDYLDFGTLLNSPLCSGTVAQFDAGNNSSLAHYVNVSVECMIQIDQNNTGITNPLSHYAKVAKNMYKGMYDQIKLEIFEKYKLDDLNPECPYFNDDNAVFIASLSEEELEQDVLEGISELFNGGMGGSSCETDAINRTVSWMYMIPQGCVDQLVLDGYCNDDILYYPDLDQNGVPYYDEQDLINSSVNPDHLEQLFYNYAIATCATNNWGWFYDPGAGNPGKVEYDAVIAKLNSTQCSDALDNIEVSPSPVQMETEFTNQDFPDCFFHFFNMINDGLAVAHDLNTPVSSCGGSLSSCDEYVLNVNATNYPELANECSIEGNFIFIEEISNAGKYENKFDSYSPTCKLNLKIDYDPVIGNPNADSWIIELMNPVKYSLYDPYLVGQQSNVVVFDALYANGNVGTAYILSGELTCIPFGSFSDLIVDEMPPLDLPVSEEVEDDCVEMMTEQAIDIAEVLYQEIMNDLESQFQETSENCLNNSSQQLKLKYWLKEYQYTLYYYDLAGNLVQTVPPQGVDKLSAIEFPSGVWSNVEPNHTMETRYKYNGLNTLIEQYTPDGGHSDFYLDKLYRVRYSQNADQLSGNRASYTKYDELGRVIEAGEYRTLGVNPALEVENSSYPLNVNRMDYTETYYEEPYPNDAGGTILTSFNGGEQKNLRNAIGAIYHHQADYDANNSYILGTAVNSVISYSYDAHKNVEQVVTTNYSLEQFDQHNKSVEYEYDLLSGNVNEVIYQKGKEDEYHHRYYYDANNRLVLAETTRDGGVVWSKEAKYFYYLHGSLARVELGEDEVQGVDYAYNLQGWLKGVNSTTLKTTRDIGGDARNGDNEFFGVDVFGFSLGYYDEDYIPISASSQGFENFFAKTDQVVNQNIYAGNDMSQLFNGNITNMVTALRKTDESAATILANNYRYDQLQRIKAMDAYSAVSTVANNSFDGATLYNGGGYQCRYSFDKNGNLKTLTRKDGAGALMDELSYNYLTSSVSTVEIIDPVHSNRLGSVNDGAGEIHVGVDLSNQTSGNYQYNEIGQLIKDNESEIERIHWTVTGKVKEIEFTPSSSKGNIKFIYGPMDMRIAKKVYNGGCQNATTTYYAYDAQGNVMATYERRQAPPKIDNGYHYEDTYSLKENMIYGASRLGVDTRNILLVKSDLNYSGSPQTLCGTNALDWSNISQHGSDKTKYLVGEKYYELANHLGNVLDVISDRKVKFDNGGTNVYSADVLSYSDYYPYGMLMGGSEDPFTYDMEVATTVLENNFNTTSDLENWAAFGASSVVANGSELVVASNTDNTDLTLTANFVTLTPGSNYKVKLKIDKGAAANGTLFRLGIGSLSGSTWDYSNMTDLTDGYNEIIFTAGDDNLFFFWCNEIGTTYEVDYFIIEEITTQTMTGISEVRNGSEGDDYRYGFQGQEMDDEVKGEGNSVNYKYRMHDPRVGRFFARDPLAWQYVHYSPYQFSGNKVIHATELEGLEERMMTESQDPGHQSIMRVNGMSPATGRNDAYMKHAVHEQGKVAGVGLVVIFTGGAVVALSPEIVATYLLEEGLEYAFEEATGIPVLLDPVDFVEQLIKKGGRKLSVEAVEKLKHYAYNIKHYGQYAADKMKKGWTKLQRKNFIYNAKHYGKENAELYSKGAIKREEMVAGGICFVAGTKIKTSNGENKIEDIKVGEMVWSFNEKTQENVLNRVVSLFRKDSVTTLVELVIDNEKIYTTEEHPFYVGDDWVNAKDLKPEDQLTTYSTEKVIRVSHINFIDTLVTVYNFKVENNHNYFVSSYEILVHNNNCAHPGSAKGALSDDLVDGVKLDGGYEFNDGLADFVISDIEKVAGGKNSALTNVTTKFEELAKASGSTEVRIQFNYVVNDKLRNDAEWAAKYGYDYKFIPSETGPGNVVWTKTIE